MSYRILEGDVVEQLRTLPDESVDSIVTDPPYHLTTGKKGGTGEASVNLNTPYGRARITTGFMGMKWDGGDIAHDPEVWRECLRVLKPGGYLLSFGGARTYHRMACAIEDAGFEIRDQIMWIYGSGFPKSLDVSKAIDKMADAKREVLSAGKPVKRMIPGADQNKVGWIKNNGREFVPTVTAAATDEAKQWSGWGTALKPAHEPIVLARKPLEGTVAANVQEYGTGALNIDACRIGTDGGSTQPSGMDRYNAANAKQGYRPGTYQQGVPEVPESAGRWPANVIHDGSEEVMNRFPQTESGFSDGFKNGVQQTVFGKYGAGVFAPTYGDSGSAARFFYCAKASPEERGDGNKHPTVKPIALMTYLCQLVTPVAGTILDPFMGSGSTGIAALRQGFNFVGIELNPEYVEMAKRRIEEDAPLFNMAEA